MYDNIGGKIKAMSKWVAIVQAVVCFAVGGVLVIMDNGSIIRGLILMLAGPFVAWLSSWLLYGFGEIIDKLGDIERNTRGGEIKSETQAKIDAERIKKLEELRFRGVITEEEYKNAAFKGQ